MPVSFLCQPFKQLSQVPLMPRFEGAVGHDVNPAQEGLWPERAQSPNRSRPCTVQVPASIQVNAAHQTQRNASTNARHIFGDRQWAGGMRQAESS
ncbi:hypothetical protein GCM10010841_30240 [Deinococcus aerophilus]|uniref:Uncharacterized protein n=1 Tax=Deinococcus aerophilus TaxID=522488 RepID=A0ABQ2GYG0_9DEIO|nr:hypothetical protein GCM10010841_30240 [Deinococcus aerophilus]